jgi:hypothetical protein
MQGFETHSIVHAIEVAFVASSAAFRHDSECTGLQMDGFGKIQCYLDQLDGFLSSVRLVDLYNHGSVHTFFALV